MKYKFGDMVYINKSDEFYHDVKGQITGYTEKDDGTYYYVLITLPTPYQETLTIKEDALLLC